MELANTQDTAPKEGDSSGTMFMLDNEYGQGNLKKCAAPFMKALEFSSLRELVEGAQNVEVVLVSSQRQDKNDKEKFYLNVKEIQVV